PSFSPLPRVKSTGSFPFVPPNFSAMRRFLHQVRQGAGRIYNQGMKTKMDASDNRTIEFGPATAEDIPGVVELCMLVEEQHEAYWPLRWERRPGLKEGYTNWMLRRVAEGGKNRMLTAVARDVSLNREVVGAILVTIEKEVPIYTYSEYALVQDLAVRESHRR